MAGRTANSNDGARPLHVRWKARIGRVKGVFICFGQVLALLTSPTRQQSPAVSDSMFNSTGFACLGCLAVGRDGAPMQIRAMFFESPGVVQNDAAQRMARLKGIPHDCASSSRAVPQCFQAEHWDKGWIGELFFDIVHETGGEVVAMTAANFSSETTEYASSDAFTRCAREVQIGRVDVCVSDMWETEARRSISTFTSPLHIDVFKLVTKTQEVGFQRQQLVDFAKPFEMKAWLVIIGTVVIGGILMGAVDDMSSYAVWIDTTRRGKAMAALQWPARRFVLLGFASFTLLTSSSYFAWQAHFVSQHWSDLRPALISSFADAVASGRPLCMLGTTIGLVQRPGMKVETVDTVWKALENVQSNRCIGAVIGGDEYLSYVSAQTARYDRCPAGQTDICLDSVDLGTCLCTVPGQIPQECPADCPNYHRFCDLLQVQDPVFLPASSVALPVGSWLQDILSAWIVKKRLNGHVDKLRRLYVEDPNPPACDKELHIEELLPIRLESLAGIFVLSGSLMCLGLLWHLVMACMFRSKVRPDHSAAGGNYRADSVARGIAGTSSFSGASRTMVPAEFRLETLSLADNMKSVVEESTGRNEDRLIRQEERIVRQDRKLDELRAVLDDLNGKLGTEMAAETQNFETSLSAAVARLKVSEEEVLQKQRELEATHGAIETRDEQIASLHLQLQEATMESVNIKQVVGERVGETFELKRLLNEREEEVQQLKEGRAAMTEELMQAKGQLGEKTGQVHELRQQSDETRVEFEQVQGRLNESLAELTRVKMQMDLQMELHAERERELSQFAGSNAVESLELRQQNEERWSELNKLREGAGERAGEMFELRQALNERTEEIIDLKGQLGERAWELLELKQQLGERAGEVLAANEKSQKADDELVQSKSLCVEWRWQADELRKELDGNERKLEMLSNENAKLFGDNAALRHENSTLQEMASQHAREKADLSETQTSILGETVSQKDAEIAGLKEDKVGLESEVAELKTLVGQHAAEILEVRSLLQDRCREVVDLETKIKEKQEQIGALQKETAMRAVEAEEHRQQMTVLWDLGGKVQTLMELDLGGKVQHMTDILQKVDCVLESKELAEPSDDISPPPRHLHSKANGNISTPLHQPARHHAVTPHMPQRYEASNTYAPETMGTQSMEASLPVPPIAFKPPQTADDWNQLAHEFTPNSGARQAHRGETLASAHGFQSRHGTPHTDVLSPSEVFSPRSDPSHADSQGPSRAPSQAPSQASLVRITGHGYCAYTLAPSPDSATASHDAQQVAKGKCLRLRARKSGFRV